MAPQTPPHRHSFYQIYGLILKTNRPVDQLLAAPADSPVDVQVHFKSAARSPSKPHHALSIYQSPGQEGDSAPIFQVWRDERAADAFLGIQYHVSSETATFLCDQQGLHIQVLGTAGMPFQDSVTYLLGPVMGCLLRLRQTTCLHAGVVALDGHGLALIGPKGSGKSTALAAFAQEGWAVLSDDLAVLAEKDGRFMVSPGYPNLRLWPDTTRVLPGVDPTRLSPILSISDKRFLPLAVKDSAEPWRFHAQPIPLKAIYLLGERSRSEPLTISPLSQAQGLLTLVANVYPEYEVRPSDRTRDFAFLARLAANIPMRMIRGQPVLNALPQLTGAIQADALNLM